MSEVILESVLKIQHENLIAIAVGRGLAFLFRELDWFKSRFVSALLSLY